MRGPAGPGLTSPAHPPRRRRRGLGRVPRPGPSAEQAAPDRTRCAAVLDGVAERSEPGGDLRRAACTEDGSFGDVLANACRAKGLGGLVTDTGVRDTEEPRAPGFPAFSRSVSVKGSSRRPSAPLREPVTVAGELIHPGHVLDADADAVVVVRRGHLADATAASRRRVDTEAEFIAAYRAGRTAADLRDPGRPAPRRPMA